MIDRSKALELGCYLDARAEGCHDWDTFCRFIEAGHAPRHLPELLYSWRMHSGSTSGNYKSKPYIYASHRFVLERFLASRGRLEKYELTLAPIFDGYADARFSPRKDLSSLHKMMRPVIGVDRLDHANGVVPIHAETKCESDIPTISLLRMSCREPLLRHALTILPGHVSLLGLSTKVPD